MYVLKVKFDLCPVVGTIIELNRSEAWCAVIHGVAKSQI